MIHGFVGLFADLYNSEGNLFMLEEIKGTFATYFNFIYYHRVYGYA